METLTMAEKEYVEKQDALNAICKACDRQHPDDKENCPQKFAGCMEFYNVFELPAADVEPVRHGRWIVYEVANTDEEQPIAWECSECGEVVEAKHNYCPDCGAKMDGRADNG
jgi:RNA polymerase subunit RPABC4/transcription elongation factor Spt4